MSKYSVDFDITSVELLPIHKREDNIQNLTYSLARPLNDLEQIFEYLREGSAAGAYNAGTTYVYGDLINYQRRVYFRNEVTTSYVAGIAPNNTTYFVKVLDFQIGLDERIKFANGKLILEYALNRVFGTSFNQPPVLSDIYITRISNLSDSFEVGQTEEESSTVSQFEADADWSIPEFEPASLVTYDYTVNVPVAVWTALAGTSNERNNIILSVLNKYKLHGFIANVVTY
jgi:hypothetical protein